MRDAMFSRRDMLRAGGALTVGAVFAEQPKAAAPEPDAGEFDDRTGLAGDERLPVVGGFGDARGDAPDDRDQRHPLARGRAG